VSTSDVSALERPRVRYLDAFPVDSDGQRLIYLRDPEGLTDQTLAVPVPAYFLMMLFDGEHSIPNLIEAFARQFEGHDVSEGQVRELIAQLEDAHFLDSPGFQAFREEIEQAYLDAPTREAAHAGASYPNDPDELRALIDSFFQGVDRQPRADIEGLIAPHIDFNRGGACFAHSYGALPKTPPADRFVIFGTGHSARRPFVMSRKDFETPLGTLKADVELIDRIAAKVEGDPFENEICHRGEHSIEFQAVFLKYLYPDSDIRFVPVLCGSLGECASGKTSPASLPEVSGYIEAFMGALNELGGTTCFIAGVDFSHVGSRFGDSGELTDAFIDDVESCDRELLDFAAKGDPEGFFNVIAREQDRTRVCGTSSIYTMLHLLPQRSGTLLDYDKAVDKENGSMVSFAGMAFGKAG